MNAGGEEGNPGTGAASHPAALRSVPTRTSPVQKGRKTASGATIGHSAARPEVSSPLQRLPAPVVGGQPHRHRRPRSGTRPRPTRGFTAPPGACRQVRTLTGAPRSGLGRNAAAGSRRPDRRPGTCSKGPAERPGHGHGAAVGGSQGPTAARFSVWPTSRA